MADLIILKKNPQFIKDFLYSPSRIPRLMHLERVKYWEKQFYVIKEEFKKTFSYILREDELNDLEALYHIRNAIAHPHVSLGRDYILFRPARGLSQEREIKRVFGLTPIQDESDPMMLKLTFQNDDRYFRTFSLFKKLDEICFERLSSSIGIPHSRIR